MNRYKDRYAMARRREKRAIAEEVVQKIKHEHDGPQPARFLKQIEGRGKKKKSKSYWVEEGNQRALEKVGHVLRGGQQGHPSSGGGGGGGSSSASRRSGLVGGSYSSRHDSSGGSSHHHLQAIIDTYECSESERMERKNLLNKIHQLNTNKLKAIVEQYASRSPHHGSSTHPPTTTVAPVARPAAIVSLPAMEGVTSSAAAASLQQQLQQQHNLAAVLASSMQPTSLASLGTLAALSSPAAYIAAAAAAPAMALGVQAYPSQLQQQLHLVNALSSAGLSGAVVPDLTEGLRKLLEERQQQQDPSSSTNANAIPNPPRP